jgi:hypothetical protein
MIIHYDSPQNSELDILEQVLKLRGGKFTRNHATNQAVHGNLQQINQFQQTNAPTQQMHQHPIQRQSLSNQMLFNQMNPQNVDAAVVDPAVALNRAFPLQHAYAKFVEEKYEVGSVFTLLKNAPDQRLI